VARPVLHQVTIGAVPGDAITDHAFTLRRWLRDMGFSSQIYARQVHPTLAREVRPLAAYRPRPSEKWLVYHHSVGSSVTEWLLDRSQRLIVIYHNVTPARFFEALSPALARQMAVGREQLCALRSRTALALADSPYNERELREAGFPETGVLPIVLDEGQYDLPSNPEIVARFEGAGPLLLFVGRLVPNKKQEDLVKLLYFYQRIEPSARLVLVGSAWLSTYERALREFSRALGVGEAVLFTGRVSQQDLVTYYRLADVYVSMSEHEGFGKPLIESMYLDLPVLAYAAGAVPDTLGGAGILFRHKHYEALAEMVDMLRCDRELYRRIVARQRARVRAFTEPNVRRKWGEFLDRAGLSQAELRGLG